MSLSDRVAGKSGAAATFSFTTTAGGALAAGSNVSVQVPDGFFSGCTLFEVVFFMNVSGIVSECGFSMFTVTIMNGVVGSYSNVNFSVFGVVLGSVSSSGLNYGVFRISSSSDPVFAEVISGPILGHLSSSVVFLSQYLKHSATELIFEFKTPDPSLFKCVSIRAIYGFSVSNLKVRCLINKLRSVDVLGCTYDGAVFSVFLNAPTKLDQNSNFGCTMSGLFTPMNATTASRLSVITFDSSDRPLDAAFSVEFPPIFDTAATHTPGSSPLTLSSAIRSQLLSEFLVSFTSSGAEPIALITVQGLRDFQTSQFFFTSTQSCSHNSNTVLATTIYSSPFLTIAINGTEIAYLKSSIVCSIKGLILPSNAEAGKDDIVISSFGANGAAVDTLAGVALPAIFAAEATDVRVSLSSYVSGSENVVMTLSFVSPNTPLLPKGTIKTVSITGVFFSNFSASDDVTCQHQFGVASGYATFVYSAYNPLLVIKTTGTDVISSGTFPITCIVSGFTNSLSKRASSLSFGLTTWDVMNTPIDIATNDIFPDIFAFFASNGSIGLSSQVVSKLPVMLTINFNAPYTGLSIGYITVSGIFFAASLQHLPPAAECYVDSPSQRVQARFVVFISAKSELALTFVSSQLSGLPTGAAGSYLAVTCTITNLVNVPDALTARSTVSIASFGIDAAPLYLQSAITFPVIVEQSLGFNRPRVS
jgi:hypothetical protein